MDEKILFIGDLHIEPTPVSGANHAFEEAVQRAVDARIAEFAASLEKAIWQHGSILAEMLKKELRNWAQSSVASGSLPAGSPVFYCNTCGNPYPMHSESHGRCSTCHHDHETGCYVPPIPIPPASACCGASVFEADGKRVCSKCRLTRPL